MERFGDIVSVTFGQTDLSLPVSVRVLRRAQPRPAGGDSDAFPTSIQLDRPVMEIEVRLRGTDVAESLSVGQAEVLTAHLAPTRSGQAGRTVSIDKAVLVRIELHYEQSTPASATLGFCAASPDGGLDPFAAQESQP